MGSNGESERELERCIDCVLEEMDRMYGADLTEAAKIDSKMSDIKFREDLIGQMKEVIRCKKISERFMAEQPREVRYCMKVSIDGAGMSYELSRDDVERKR